MDFSTLFRLGENLNLDRKTFVFLRWIAIIGQFIALIIVYFFLQLEFPIIFCLTILFLGLVTNLFLQFKIKSIQLKDFNAAFFLFYDLIQLSLLLYLTGGISNPFSILMIIPTIVSSTFLSMGTTIILGLLTVLFLFLLTIFHFPLPGIHDDNNTFPKLYLTGYFLAIIVGLVFISYFGIRFSGASKRRTEAVNKLQQVLAKEYELESLGGQAAAAAHSLGTPLATISIVSKELKKELINNKELSKDIDLLISQSKRCGEILKKISRKQIIDDDFLSTVKIDDLIEEIINSFRETSSKKISLISDNNNINIERNPEIIYGLRNFIGNAVKFSKSKVDIILNIDSKIVEIKIQDDGPGFAEDIIDILGEPYIQSKSQELTDQVGTGLGTFLGKTLLERKGAKIIFSNNSKFGASVQVSWNLKDIAK